MPPPQFTLGIEFLGNDLALVRASGLQVVLVRSLADQRPANVVWTAFPPFENNLVAWEGARSLFASTSPIADRRPILVLTSVEARERSRNVLTAGGSFAPSVPDPMLASGQYELENRYMAAPKLTFGVAQDLLVNGTPLTGAPINAASVPATFQAIFEPLEELTLLLATDLAAGEVVPAALLAPTVSAKGIVFSQATTLSFGAGVTSIKVRYDSATGTFVQQAGG